MVLCDTNILAVTMKISYDAEVDALSIIFRETTVTTVPLAEGITAEYSYPEKFFPSLSLV